MTKWLNRTKTLKIKERLKTEKMTKRLRTKSEESLKTEKKT